jgi:hypothetical protein
MTRRRIDALDAAMIAMHRYKKTPIEKRQLLREGGVSESEALLILTFQVMASPEDVTDLELKGLALVKAELERKKTEQMELQ